jgi:hypothetical protein
VADRVTMVVGSRQIQQPTLAPAAMQAQLAELMRQNAELLQRAARQQQVLIDHGLSNLASMPAEAKKTPVAPRPPMRHSVPAAAKEPSAAAQMPTKRPSCEMSGPELDEVEPDEDVLSDDDEVHDAAKVPPLACSPRVS